MDESCPFTRTSLGIEKNDRFRFSVVREGWRRSKLYNKGRCWVGADRVKWKADCNGGTRGKMILFRDVISLFWKGHSHGHFQKYSGCWGKRGEPQLHIEVLVFIGKRGTFIPPISRP